ncbi:MAG: hypothetical protein ACLGIG_00010 [Actinomycetes bacterium]
MSRSVVVLLLVLDVAAVVAVTRYLVRWWRGGSGAAGGPAADGSDAPMAVPTLTVLPRVAFVPPPRRELARARGLLSSA